MNGWRPPFIAGNPLYIDVSGDLMNGWPIFAKFFQEKVLMK